MTKTTHATVGICSSYYLSAVAGINPILPIIIGVFTSLLPDIDTGKSMINRLLIRVKLFRNKWMKVYYLLLTIGFYIGYYFTENQILGILCVLTLLLVLGEHRTWFHSLLMNLPVAIIMSFLHLDSKLIVIGILNYSLHSILDSFNPSGVMLLYPISKKSFRFPITFRSNAWSTRLIEYTADVAMLYLTFVKYSA